jgi:methylenetetrahydrofolate reductase (NADPH)
MPVYSVKMMGILAGMCGATITDDLSQGIDSLPEGDTEALLAFGIDFAYRQCAELLKAGVPGLHIYTMDRWKSSAGVVTRLRTEGLL